MTDRSILTSEKRFYRVIISRELHAYASSESEAMDMARNSEKYALPKLTAEVMDAPPDEAIPL